MMLLASQNAWNKSLGLEFGQGIYDQLLKDHKEEKRVVQKYRVPTHHLLLVMVFFLSTTTPINKIK